MIYLAIPLMPANNSADCEPTQIQINKIDLKIYINNIRMLSGLYKGLKLFPIQFVEQITQIPIRIVMEVHCSSSIIRGMIL